MKTIQNPRVEREELFRGLYLEAFPKVAAFISKNGGGLEQAKDLFQEALVIYYEQVELAHKPLKKNATAYLLGTVRYLWYQHQNGKGMSQSLDELVENFADEQPDLTASTNNLMHVLETAGKKCMDMLRAFYYEQEPLANIARQFGFGSVRSATVQKYKCIEKVRNEVKEKALTYADFAE